MLKNYTNYYYYSLPEDQRAVYKAFYEAIRDKKPYVDLVIDKNSFSINDAATIMRYVYNDNPSFFYLDTLSCTYVRTWKGYRYGLDYVYSPEEIERYESLLKKGLEWFVRTFIKSGMSDFEKEIAIHDFLVKNVEYDYEVLEQPTKHSQDPYNVLGPLLKSKAVCWGYACAFKLLCDYSGLKCIVVTGDGCSDMENGPHAWNIIKLDGVPYHVDTTWDVREKGATSVCYDYLNLDDKIMRLDHRWDASVYPACDSFQYNYYYYNRLYVSDIAGFKRMVAEELKKGKRVIAIKYIKELPPSHEISNAAQMALMETGYHNSFYYSANPRSHNIYIELVT